MSQELRLNLPGRILQMELQPAILRPEVLRNARDNDRHQSAARRNLPEGDS